MEKKKIYLPKSVTLPCKLKWAVDNNSVVSFNQIIAFIIENKNEYIDENNNNLCNKKDLLNDKDIHLEDKTNNSSDKNNYIENENNLNDKTVHLNGVLNNINDESDNMKNEINTNNKDNNTNGNINILKVEQQIEIDTKPNEKNNVINFILSNRKNSEIRNNYIALRSNNHGRITIVKNNFNLEKDEYIYINDPSEVLCEISDAKCSHEIIFSGLCTNCLLSQEEINKNKEEQKYFLTPGFLTNENELFINSDKALDLEKERIKNIIENKKLCLVLDLDNTLLHASFFLLSVNMNSEIINITTDLDGNLENEMNYLEELSNHVYNINNTKNEINKKISVIERYIDEKNVHFDQNNVINNDNIANTDIDTNIDNHIEVNNNLNADKNDNDNNYYNKANFLYDDIRINEEMIEDYLYSLFYKKKSNMEYNNKHQDIKSSYDNYCNFLEKLNTINLLKKNGKFIHYENLNDKNIKKKIEKLELSVLKTNVKYQKGSYTIYYKLRPGVIQFLQKMNEKYELYLYTMGTLEHAKSCLFLLDPLKKFFGNRIFSRKDSVDGLKHMNRILPTYRSISICIDDSDYIWRERSSCIKVHGYNFFPEINFLEDIKRKPYFLTKFFSLAQSYLNFSTTLYRFINFKCNEYEKLKEVRKDNILYNYINLNNSLNNYKNIGNNLGISLELEEDNIKKINNGKLNFYKNEGANTNKTNLICETNENEVNEERKKTKNENENEDFLILQNYNSLNVNDDESFESNEDNFIDLDKEFETDNENEIEADSNLSNSCQLNIFSDLGNFNKTYDCEIIKEEIRKENNNENIINTKINENKNKNYNNENEYNDYENNMYDEKLDIINLIKKENSPSLLNNISGINNQKEDKSNCSSLKYKTEETKSEEFLFLNNIAYQNVSLGEIGNILHKKIEGKRDEEIPQNSSIEEKMFYSQNENFLKKEENVLHFEKAENLDHNETKNLVPIDENDVIKNNNSDLLLLENNAHVDIQSITNINNSSNITLPKTHKDLNKNQNKKKKKINKKSNIKSKDILNEDEISNNIIPFSILKTEEKYICFEDEIIFKFISEKNYRKYDKYVLNFLNNYFEEEELKRRNQESEKIDEIDIKKKEIDKNYNSVTNKKKKNFKKFDVSNNKKKVKKKIKKIQVKRFVQFQNLSKNKIFNQKILKGKKRAIKDSFKLKNEKLDNQTKKANKNEYYESFFIPKNLKEPKFKDNDKQLYYLGIILDEIHNIFYKIFEHFKTYKISEENSDNNIYNYFLRYPVVRTILIEFRKQVLRDCIFNISLLSDDIKRSDFIDQIVKLGGIINNKNYTHLLTINNLVKNDKLKNVKISNLMWIERALYTWKNIDTRYYNANNWERTHRNFWDVIEYEEKKNIK
ncbi:NLI interacting factor-like phosphatase, putative [Plasmodium relictum]|uniref:protein-serine/threonine phosphatase n=1 Tax=Plasmodium relictum TaxID=85471 RepID=A0A1J1H8B9_PLARL|nr:NLI interacting factor-like phosphatase, putative [Plasmodium relictum]CRG99680.1 NLI interacting factor-like phosphatase, putative [Plasmodium relictum]